MFSGYQSLGSTTELMNSVGDDLFQRHPELMRLTYPRRYRVPSGYRSSKRVAQRMASVLDAAPVIEGPRGDVTTKMSLEVVRKLVEYQVPTYWLGREFLEASIRTDLPNVDGSTLHWPLPAMLFMLPQNVLLNPKGASVNFLGVALCANQRLVCWTQVDELTGPPNYAISEFIYQKILSSIRVDRIHDEFEIYAYDENDPEAEQNFTTTLLVLGINLLLIMNAHPELIEMGQAPRPRGFSRRNVVDMEAPWTPNWIGRHYRLRREQTARTQEDGQQDSDNARTLRPHWRRGHLKNQRYGTGLQQLKLVWIAPVFVNGNRFTNE